MRQTAQLEPNYQAEELLGIKLQRKPGVRENLVMYSQGDRKPLEDFAYKGGMMCFQGCSRCKELGRQVRRQEDQLGGSAEVQVTDEGGLGLGDGRGGKKSSWRYILS